MNMLKLAIANSEWERFIQERVRSGEYASVEEVAAAGLAMLRDGGEDAKLPADELADLRREIGVGVEQADRGEFVEFSSEDVIQEGLKRLRNGA
jgi:antitoxin ParD1/3/4